MDTIHAQTTEADPQGLRRLVEQWRANQVISWFTNFPSRDRRQCLGVSQAYEHCANELESALAVAVSSPRSRQDEKESETRMDGPAKIEAPQPAAAEPQVAALTQQNEELENLRLSLTTIEAKPQSTKADQLRTALTLAKEATNGWGCYARTNREHEEISRLHTAIYALEERQSNPAQRATVDVLTQQIAYLPNDEGAAERCPNGHPRRFTYPDKCVACERDEARATVDALTAALRKIKGHVLEIEMHCPCGARPESLHTYSHVVGCPVASALRELALLDAPVAASALCPCGWLGAARAILARYDRRADGASAIRYEDILRDFHAFAITANTLAGPFPGRATEVRTREPRPNLEGLA